MRIFPVLAAIVFAVLMYMAIIERDALLSLVGAGPGLSRLEIDINGDRNADFVLELWNTSQLTAGDLLL